MGAAIAILTSLAVLVFWLSRAASNAHHITDAANELANLPRKRRFMKNADKHGTDLIDDPREAAAVLMVAVARLRGDGRVNDEERGKMIALLHEYMAIDPAEGEDFIDNVRWLTRDYKQADSVLRPMVNFLRKTISSSEADDLAHMITEISLADGSPTTDQVHLIKKYREYMGLNVGA